MNKVRSEVIVRITVIGSTTIPSVIGRRFEDNAMIVMVTTGSVKAQLTENINRTNTFAMVVLVSLRAAYWDWTTVPLNIVVVFRFSTDGTKLLV